MSDFDYSSTPLGILVAHVKAFQAHIAYERDEALLTHYKLHLESATAELQRRNDAEIALRAVEKLS